MFCYLFLFFLFSSVCLNSIFRISSLKMLYTLLFFCKRNNYRRHHHIRIPFELLACNKGYLQSAIRLHMKWSIESVPMFRLHLLSIAAWFYPSCRNCFAIQRQNFCRVTCISEMINFPDRDSLSFRHEQVHERFDFFAKAVFRIEKFPSHGPSAMHRLFQHGIKRRSRLLK